MASERDTAGGGPAHRRTSGAPLAGAALIGATGGMRTFTGPAALAARGRLLAGSPARYALLAAAAGEYAGDKSSAVPARVSAPSLLARAASGAVSGGVLAGAPGALAGGAAATGATFATYRARQALGELTGVPDPVWGIAEDGVAIAAAALATRPRPEPADEPEAGAPARRLARGAVRGLAAGVAGTAAMSVAQIAVMRATGRGPSRAPEQVGRKLARRFAGKRVPRRQRDTLNWAMHWAYGSAWGIPLGLASAAAGTRPPVLVGGATFGLSVWGAGLVQMPALGVAAPPWKQAPAALASDAGYHLVYGVVAAAVARSLP